MRTLKCGSTENGAFIGNCLKWRKKELIPAQKHTQHSAVKCRNLVGFESGRMLFRGEHTNIKELACYAIDNAKIGFSFARPGEKKNDQIEYITKSREIATGTMLRHA